MTACDLQLITAFSDRVITLLAALLGVFNAAVALHTTRTLLQVAGMMQ
jgi:hypothetical protein